MAQPLVFRAILDQLEAEYERLRARNEGLERLTRDCKAESVRSSPLAEQEPSTPYSPSTDLDRKEKQDSVGRFAAIVPGSVPEDKAGGVAAESIEKTFFSMNSHESKSSVSFDLDWLEDKDALGEASEQVKKKVRASVVALIKPRLSQEDLMHTEGLSQRIARSQVFVNLTLGVIAFNALWIFIDTDYNKPEFPSDWIWIFEAMEHFFCVFFCFELGVTFLAYQRKLNAFKDPWFVFNSILLAQMIFDAWVTRVINALMSQSGSGDGGALGNLRILRLLRLTRLFRMLRFMRAMPELLYMVKGILKAARSVAITLGMLTAVLYVAGITCVQLSEGLDIEEEYFRTVPHAMINLALHAALLDDVAEMSKAVGAESTYCAIVIVLTILLAALTMMNMLIGVLCEVMSAVAASEKEKLEGQFVKDKVRTILTDTGLDADGDGTISVQEFKQLLMVPEACQVLREVDVDPCDLVDFAKLLFQNDDFGQRFDKKLDFNDFMELVLKFRATNVATVRDIVDMMRFTHSENTRRNRQLAKIDERIKFEFGRRDEGNGIADKYVRYQNNAFEERLTQRYGKTASVEFRNKSPAQTNHHVAASDL